MRFEFKIAWLYFRSRRKSLARFTAAAAVIGIAAGVAALILANALAAGFAKEMRDKILANTAHVSVFMADGAAIDGWQLIKEKIETLENVAAVEPTTYENALLVGASETSYAVLKAQNQSRLAGSRIHVGARLAEKLNLKIGDRAEIATVENNQPTRVSVAEIFQTGLYDYDSTWIYCAPEMLAHLQRRESFAPSVLSVSVRDVYQSNETADWLRRDLGDRFKVVDWQEANQPLFAALSLERRVALAIIGLIIFVAALNITTTLALLVNERRLDIAVLRTCGVRAASLIYIFTLEGLFLGFVGIALGAAGGLLGCFLGNRFKLVSLSKEVYSLSYVPFYTDASDFTMIVLSVLLLCLAATVYPARAASRIKPLENLRRQ